MEVVFLGCGARLFAAPGSGHLKGSFFLGFAPYSSEARVPARMRRAARYVSPNSIAA